MLRSHPRIDVEADRPLPPAKLVRPLVLAPLLKMLVGKEIHLQHHAGVDVIWNSGVVSARGREQPREFVIGQKVVEDRGGMSGV